MVVLQFFSLFFGDLDAQDEMALGIIRVFVGVRLEQVHHVVNVAPSTDAFSEGTICHELGDTQLPSGERTGRMRLQPFKDGFALKAEPLDRHDRVLHDLVGDAAEEFVGDIFFSNGVHGGINRWV